MFMPAPHDRRSRLVGAGLLQFPQELRGIHGINGIGRKSEKHQAAADKRTKHNANT